MKLHKMLSQAAILIAAIVPISLANCGYVSAQELAGTAKDLVAECDNSAEKCRSYLMGAYEGSFLAETMHKNSLYCPPDHHVDGEQLRRLFLGAARADPQDLGAYGVVFAVNAFQIAFPCADKK